MTDLAARLIGSWDLQSRIDRNAAGEQRHEPGLGSDPFGFLVFDRTGHFAAQFMKRDRKSAVDAPATAAAVKNSFARGGYDAYFGTYSVDSEQGTLRTLLVRALSGGSVGQTFVRKISIEGDLMTLALDTATSAGEPVHRTLIWKRVG